MFSHYVMFDSLWPHGLQHTWFFCPSLSPWVSSNSHPLSQWCHSIKWSSITPFSWLQFFPASGSFPMSQFFASGGQSIRASASAAVLPMNIQGSFPLGLTGFISLLSKDSQESSPAPHFESVSILWRSAFFMVQLSHPYMRTRKTIAFTIQTFVGKVMSLLFKTLSRFDIVCQILILISWWHSLSTLISEHKKTEIWHCFHIFPIYIPWCDRTRCHDISFLNVKF